MRMYVHGSGYDRMSPPTLPTRDHCKAGKFERNNIIMSAEPRRKAPYSDDISWRVVWQKIGMGLKFRTIARNLSMSLGTVQNHFKRFEETGSLKSKSRVPDSPEW